ncbi:MULTISPECIES: glucuronate isomerase [Caproicibacterium]|uniref:Uronate isomerase n=1 Tax=Caproicibacterium argilliputei TaxID=3030016 RepID=A0AA97DAV2_9FIRM|nr:glucuronate isomerase [Caproicibacterium argilliputei]WOC32832.1 glucuronate isomerase [Caproicibacterium argilliputei]
MKPFLSEDFLLSNDTAKTLYHQYAEKMPILDYHCHINPQEIAENRQFDNITQVWLGGDHYKWRLMRANGIPEEEITGTACSDREKFQHFAEVLPKAIGNPLYHWTHLELKRYFSYTGTLSPETAEEVWNLCNRKLQTSALRVRGILQQSHVKLVCTTDDPIDSLVWHQKIREDDTCGVKVLPAWRPDKILKINQAEFAPYLQQLAAVSETSIATMPELFRALQKRLDFFNQMGCRTADHGIDTVPYAPAEESELNRILLKAARGNTPDKAETEKYLYAMLLFLGREYAKRGWVMQIHYGALRNANSAMFQKLGADTGYDSIAVQDCSAQLAGFLDVLERTKELPKTILYALNPGDNAMLDSLAGSFQGSGIQNKIQHGAAWWFNDTKSGMEAQLKSFANFSVLGNFIGMLTDSRSFLSYTRHEYFRRILCNLLGTWVENGEYPADIQTLGKLAENIAFYNADRYFGFGLAEQGELSHEN